MGSDTGHGATGAADSEDDLVGEGDAHKPPGRRLLLIADYASGGHAAAPLQVEQAMKQVCARSMASSARGLYRQRAVPQDRPGPALRRGRATHTRARKGL